MLSEILKLLRECKQLSLQDISIHFRMDISALEPMMEMLTRKGKVKTLARESTSCSRSGCSCSRCSCASRESVLMYHTVENPADMTYEEDVPLL
ncbi:MAG: hypothetical protein KAR40_03975 [Candidatus Sabulitectum sp.]|nr:hypothetical protein [Candidatus Sabulitectum sp.]